MENLIKEAYYQGAEQAIADFGVKDAGLRDWLARRFSAGAPAAVREMSAGEHALESVATKLEPHANLQHPSEWRSVLGNPQAPAQRAAAPAQRAVPPPIPEEAFVVPETFAGTLRHNVRKNPLAAIGAMGAVGLGAGAITGRETAPKPYLF